MKSNRTRASSGYKSSIKAKNKNSAIKKIEPGNPRKIKQFRRAARKSLGQKKFKALISVSRRVLNRRFTASTIRNEFDESNA
jgi:hypothetical protein